MLAMDVVDTLRHQRALVESELDGEQRERRLIARVQSVYESQGIEVPPSVIAEGVKALTEDRFTYDPPERTFLVRLAEIYVERGKWALRLLFVALAGLAIWAAFAIPAHYARLSLIQTFRAEIAGARTQAQRLGRRVQALSKSRDALLPVAPDKAESEILSDASLHLEQTRSDLGKVEEWLDPGPDPELYPEEKDLLDGRLETQEQILGRLTVDLRSIGDWLDAIRELRTILKRSESALSRLVRIEVDPKDRVRLEGMAREIQSLVDRGETEPATALVGRLESSIQGLLRAWRKKASRRTKFARLAKSMDGVDLAPALRSRFDSLVQATGRAIESGNAASADSRLSELEGLVGLLDQNYELRIVSGRGQRSGVWRYQNSRGRSGPRNYYIVVEARSPRGNPVRLPILNEENQRTYRVSIFAIRVPMKVYEQVKQDKLDNGIIDNKLFGMKKRGQIEPEYRFPVAGGRITRW